MNATTIKTAINTQEKSLIDFQERLSSQEINIETLKTQKIDKNSLADRVHTKSIKSLESKTKTVFDTLNIQQNSIDTLIDTFGENEKDKKRTREQRNSVQSIKQIKTGSIVKKLLKQNQQSTRSIKAVGSAE